MRNLSRFMAELPTEWALESLFRKSATFMFMAWRLWPAVGLLGGGWRSPSWPWSRSSCWPRSRASVSFLEVSLKANLSATGGDEKAKRRIS